MNQPTWTVVKVGGSLFDLPDLRERLRAFLIRLDDPNVLLVPGGGGAADVIRELDRVHHLGEEASHWLAIEALSLNTQWLQVLLPELTIVADIPIGTNSTGPFVLQPLPFFRADEGRADHLPHRWEVTSDSLAVRAAVLFKAPELILLKSVAWEGSDWSAAARAGVVDGYFARAIQQAPADLTIRVVNLRSE